MNRMFYAADGRGFAADEGSQEARNLVAAGFNLDAPPDPQEVAPVETTIVQTEQEPADGLDRLSLEELQEQAALLGVKDVGVQTTDYLIVAIRKARAEDDTVRDLNNDGKVDDLESKNKADLLTQANELKLSIRPNATKAEIIDEIRKAQADVQVNTGNTDN